jgi:hypothetical protein
MLPLLRACAVGVAVTVAITTVAAQDPPRSGVAGAGDAANAPPVLWRDPGPIAELDLYWGAGSADRAPAPPFTFLEENTTGANPKVHVVDARGVEWSVKFAGEHNEVHSEVAASRIAWALGYLVEESYFAEAPKIDGLPPAMRALATRARFESRPKDVARLGTWDLEHNPFEGTRELSGLKMLTALLHNWDARKGNTEILLATSPDGRPERRFIVSDLGATFGRMSEGMLGRSRWDLEGYRSQPYIGDVDAKAGTLRLRYRTPFRSDITDLKVPIAHARWFEAMASQLSEPQVRRAFDASGAAPIEGAAFARAVIEKIEQLRGALRSQLAAGD